MLNLISNYEGLSEEYTMKMWKIYCGEEIKYLEIKGNCFSIFKHPDVLDFEAAFKKVLVG